MGVIKTDQKFTTAGGVVITIKSPDHVIDIPVSNVDGKFTEESIEVYQPGSLVASYIPGRRFAEVDFTFNSIINGDVLDKLMDIGVKNSLSFEYNADGSDHSTKIELDSFSVVSCTSENDGSTGQEVTQIHGVGVPASGSGRTINTTKGPIKEPVEKPNPPLPDGIIMDNLPPQEKIESNGF